MLVSIRRAQWDTKEYQETSKGSSQCLGTQSKTSYEIFEISETLKILEFFENLEMLYSEMLANC